jgi:hypothetical protein
MQGIIRRLVVSLMGTMLFLSAAFAAPRWENPLPQGNIIADVAWNGGRYVAVGNAGTVLISPDGGQWQPVASGTTAWLEAIRWNETQQQFIVTGNDGTLLTSPDGVQWTRRVSGYDGYLYGIANAGNLNVVVGSSGVVLTSNDGIRWTTRSAGVADWLNDVAWNGREFIAVGGNGTIVGSADGIHWSRRNSTLRSGGSGPSFESIAWSPGLGRWVAVTEFGANNDAFAVWSNDGRAWHAVAVGGQPLRGVAWDPGSARFVAVGGSGEVVVSADGIAWGAPNDTGYGESLESVVAGGGAWVATGEHGLILTTSDPAGGWARRTSGPLSTINAVAFDGTGYVAAGRGIILHRGDLAAATAPDLIDQAGGAALPLLHGLAWGTDGYVAVGEGGAILRSVDGVNWTREAATGANLNGVTRADNGIWYAVGARGSVVRNDGTGWNVVRSGTETLYAIDAAGNRLTAVGTRGTQGVVLTSTDGSRWSVTRFSNVQLRGVASGGGRSVAVGDGGTVLVQAGGGWVVRSAGTDADLSAVTWDGKRFVAVGRGGATFASGDGIKWSEQRVTGNDLAAIAVTAGGSFLAAGEGGTVVQAVCPCATSDRAVTLEDQPVTIDVLANDSGDNLRVAGVERLTAQGGRVGFTGDGTLTYTPAAGFSGTDTFGYTLGSSVDPAVADMATVTVVVNGRSGAPGGGSGGGGGGGGALLFLLIPLGWAVARRRRAVA